MREINENEGKKEEVNFPSDWKEMTGSYNKFVEDWERFIQDTVSSKISIL